MISVLIPCYNAQKFLPATLESVAAQTRKDIEVIIADDGSTDETVRIAGSCGLPLKVLRLPHRGVGAARNSATEASQGEYLQYLDSDDLLAPDALDLKVRALEASGADVAYSDWVELVEGDDHQFRPGAEHRLSIEQVHAVPEIALFREFWSPPAALLYTRSIVRRVGAWREDLRIMQDARYALDAALTGGRFVHVDRVAAIYRKHRFGASLATSDDAGFHREIFRNACEVRRIWAERGQAASLDHRRALSKVLGHVAGWAAQFDPVWFDEVWAVLSEIDPAYLPTRSKPLRHLSRLVGYPAAERVAAVYRRWKGHAA